MEENKYQFVRLKGAEIASVFDELAALRIAVFRDYPYLYDGDVSYEKEYLQIYSRAERAFLLGVYFDGKLVGASTCIPLTEETEDIKKPFRDNGLDLEKVFYFGESILLEEHRGQGLGHLFFDEREAHARSFGNYSYTCFCAVDRGEMHPLRPAGYRPNDAFWIKRGYQKSASLQTHMDWPDIGETASSSKPMIFWIREIQQ